MNPHTVMIDRTRRRWKESAESPIRIGAVGYLNSKPLIEGLSELVPDAELSLDYPSRLADDLGTGRLDVALIPSIEAFHDPDYEIVSDACVAARGPVLSVKVYFRRPPGLVRTLAADEGSRTSVALARVMLEERFGVTPDIRPLPLGDSTENTDAHAVLLIGDRAIRPPRERFETVWDLGEEWLAWTGLPFVFAMWVTRRGVDLRNVEEALSSARDVGLERVAEIAEREATKLGLSQRTACDYLTRNLHYRLGSAERTALRLFHRLAARHGLAPEGARVRFRERRRVAVNCGL
jgi:chorismate dehydratase